MNTAIRLSLYSVLLLSIGLFPTHAGATIVFEEKGFIDYPTPAVLGETTPQGAEDLLRQQLVALILKLQEQLRTQLQDRAFQIPDKNQSQGFDVGSTQFTARGIQITTGKSVVAPYPLDGTDADDDSLAFRIDLTITNTDREKHLIIDRESLIIHPADSTNKIITPKADLNTKTGLQNNVAEYGFAADDKKILVIKPGQSSLVVPLHAYQFKNPGKYRGYLDAVAYTHDDVTYNKDTDQFIQRGRTYTLQAKNLRTVAVNKSTLLVDSGFIDKDVADNKYNLTSFREPSVPIIFSYPEEMTLVQRNDDSWLISYKGLPYFEVYNSKEFELPTTNELLSEETGALGNDRVIQTTWSFTDTDTSGLVSRIVPASFDDYGVIYYEYADDVATFTRYPAATMFEETFKVIR